MEVILAAAQRILAEGGLAALTTARIAEVAGVSVGSLYQYFPNKHAVCGALVERTLERNHQVLRESLDATLTMPLDAAIRVTVTGLLRVLSEAPRLHAELIETLFPAERSELYQRYLGMFTELLAENLAARRDVGPDPKVAAYLVVRAGNGVGQSLAHDRPDAETFEALAAGLAEMAIRFLRRT